MPDGDDARRGDAPAADSASTDDRQPTGAIEKPQSQSYPDSLAKPEELLIHPDDEPDHGSDDPFGTPGDPVSRHSAFYVGFFGGLGILVAIVLGLAIHEVRGTLVLVVVSMFLAVGLNPLVEWFMHRGMPRPWSVFVVALCVLGFVTLFLVTLVPVLRDQITALIDSVPGWLDDLRKNQTVQDFDDKYDIIDTLKSKIQSADFAQTAFGSVFSVGLAVLNALFNAFLIFVLTLYFLAALPTIKRAAYSLAPASRRERVAFLGDQILRSVGGYVSGVFVVATCAGISSFIFLEIVGLGQYAVALALVVALLDFIPLIGATLGATVVTVIGLATSVPIAIACVIFFVAYQQVENYIIYPRVMRSSVDVPGVVTVIAVLIGGSLMGVVGAMLAIPTAAALLLLVREVWVRKQDVS
jgi:predicted PurR-regulated permease PerM